MPDKVAELLAGSVEAIYFGPAKRPERSNRSVIFPGSFNPLHDGHRRMAEIAAEQVNGDVAYEISVTNVDKPTLGVEEIRRRLGQFEQDASLWLTRATTFVEKARLFPGSTMVIGADTALRVGAERYYRNRTARDAAMATLLTLACRFLVFGRFVEGQFRTLEMLDLAPDVAALCEGVPASAFRDDLSSSALREVSAQGARKEQS